jgi:flagellar basal body L-ring protein FlgH
VGDIISIKMEEPFVKQVAEEVKKSLTPAEQEVEMALHLRSSEAAKGDKDGFRTVASDDLKTSEASDMKDRMEKAVRWSQVDLTKAIAVTPNDELRAEVIDKYKNGNFKVRAVKRVLYRGSSKLVSVVGVAPASDFDDRDIINSGKLYEYKINVAR